MNHEEFTKLVNNRLSGCKNVLIDKGDEYASDTDRLHNFVVAGNMKGESPILALYGMMVKHLVSFQDIIEQMDRDCMYCPEPELVAEKFGDCINYLLLAEGLVEDRRKELYKPAEKNELS